MPKQTWRLHVPTSKFKMVYNRVSSFNPGVIDDVLQCPEDLDHDQLPSIEELDKAINNMTLLAAPGESGLSPIAMKKLSREARMALLSIIHHYWNGLNKNREWNEVLLCIICKKKGKHDNLNNYRGVCLQDLTVRYVSLIISSRLLDMLKEHRIENSLLELGCQPLQGCRDALLQCNPCYN
jgi:hypothetical protein